MNYAFVILTVEEYQRFTVHQRQSELNVNSP